MTKEEQIAELGAKLEKLLEEADEHNFDMAELDAILKEFDELDPRPPITDEMVEAGLKRFHEELDRLYGETP